MAWRGPRGALNAPGTLFPGLTPWGLNCSVLSWVSVTKSRMTTVSHGGSSILSSTEPLPPDPEDSIPHVFLGLSFQAQAPPSYNSGQGSGLRKVVTYMPWETITSRSFPNLHAEIIFNKVKNNFLENNNYSTAGLSVVSRLRTTSTQGLLNNSVLNFWALETSDRGNCFSTSQLIKIASVYRARVN